jgi:hypothetical protein
MPKQKCIIMDDLDKNLCCQSGEGIFKAKCTVSVPGTVILTANTGLLAMQHARNQQNMKSINI